MTRDGLTAKTPAEFGAVCCICRCWTLAPLPVRYVERMSGAPITLYACPPHAETLTPAPNPGELEADT